MKILKQLNILPALLLALLSLALITPANAYGHRPSIEADSTQMGVTIDPVVHGDLQGLASQHTAIIAGAARFAGQNPDFAKLIAYSQKRYEQADRGFWPGSVSDENHPFHIPVHAYLAADQEILKRMEAMPTAKTAAQALRGMVDAAIYASGFIPGASTCSISFLVFNTADKVLPLSYMELLAYKPYQRVGYGLIALLVLGGGSTLIMRRSRRVNGLDGRAFAA